jgi:hypothetical protein
MTIKMTPALAAIDVPAKLMALLLALYTNINSPLLGVNDSVYGPPPVNK